MFFGEATNHGGQMPDNDGQIDQQSRQRENWTAQTGGTLPKEALEANQKFTPEQLPDPNVARAAGIQPQQIPQHLVLDGDDAYDHPLGPEPGERERLEHREAIKQRLEEGEGGAPQPRGRSVEDLQNRAEEGETGGDPHVGEGPSDSASETQRENAAAGTGSGAPGDDGGAANTEQVEANEAAAAKAKAKADKDNS